MPSKQAKKPEYEEDAQFIRWGVKPPEHNPHLTEEERDEEFNKILRNHHVWRQKGNMIYCIACPFEHGNSVPSNILLTGTDEEGKPILLKLSW